jgi:hypothetical protein
MHVSSWLINLSYLPKKNNGVRQLKRSRDVSGERRERKNDCANEARPIEVEWQAGGWSKS